MANETHRYWHYKSATGGLEKHLELVQGPKPHISSQDEVLVQVLSAALNPADYKLPELGLLSKAILSLPATPGIDFAGRVVATGTAVDSLKEGQLVFGMPKIGPGKHGTLAEYIVLKAAMCTPLPEGLSPDDGAAVGTAGLTSYQAIAPFVKQGARVFINGGSGGCGTWCIQIAKTLGCHVTTSCSTKNVEFCKNLGADEVLDYKEVDIIQQLQSKGQVFDLVVDNVGTPTNLYTASSSFLKSKGPFLQVGMGANLSSAKVLLANKFLPSFLGGGSGKYQFVLTKFRAEDMQKIAGLMAQQKVKAMIDSRFEFEDVVQAFEKLKLGRSRGKIVVHVAKP